MTSFDALVAVLQVIASFMIYIVSFLALFVFVILCLVTLVFLYKGADFVWAYTVKCNSQNLAVPPEMKHDPAESREFRERILHPLSDISFFRSHR
jgi:hypothetical protein